MKLSLFAPTYRKPLISAGVIALSVLLAFFYVRFGLPVILFTIGLLALSFVFLYEFVFHTAGEHPPLLILFAVATLPLQRLFLTTYPLQALGQLSAIFIGLLYWARMSARAKAGFLKKIAPVILMTAAFALSIFIAYFFSGPLENLDRSYLINVLGAVSYTFLAFILCTSLGNIKTVAWLLILIGVLQLPVMVAMSMGLTEGLPGPLSALSVQSYGGVASQFSSAAYRYPGLFGTYELLAEYLDVMILFCIGIALFSFSFKERMLALLAAFLLVIAGFYTGTRTFVASLAVGLVVLFVLSLIRLGFGKNLLKGLVIGVLLVLIIYWMSTLAIFQGYIMRFITTDLGGGYFDTRQTVWTTSIAMLQHLPFTGYGAQTMKVFDLIANGEYESPHSLYFAMTLIAGIPGLVAAALLVLTPFFWLGRVIYLKNTKPMHTWAIVFASIWSAWVINEIIIDFIRYGFYMDFVFFLIGMIASFTYLANRASGDEDSIRFR